MKGRALAALLVIASGLGCASRPAVPVAAPPVLAMPPAIVTPDEVTTEAELAARAERALMEQRWQDAVDAYGVLLAADRDGPHAAERMFALGLAYEGLGERLKARDVFLELAQRFPDGPRARGALVRAASLDAFVEDWPSLQKIGDALLGRPDIDDVDRLVGLGARGLARVETDDDRAGSDDIHTGLDLADQLHYGARDVLPVAVAQLRFALGELRRVRSERIRFDPLPPDYLAKLEERCAGLLEAQAAYGLAVRSIDPHWAAMSGYRVGEMYRSLHRDLMEIPPPPTSKTPKQKAIFFAFMHIRFRILLEKGLREMEQTVALGERTSDSSSWVTRAQAALAEMQTALADEKAQIEKMPFSEAEVKQALDILQKRTAPPGGSGGGGAP